MEEGREFHPPDMMTDDERLGIPVPEVPHAPPPLPL
jgi:hypothetical protein